MTNDDPYTLAMRLCDSQGYCQGEHLDVVNTLRGMTPPLGEHKPVEAFACTGSAHLAGDHIRCTSAAHRRST